MAFAAPAADLEPTAQDGGFAAPESDWLPPDDASIESQQTPLETGTRAAGSGGVQSVTSVLSGAGQVQKSISDIMGDTLGGVPRQMFDIYTTVPRVLGPVARKVGSAAEEFFAPDRQLNPKSATVGSAIGQTPAMLGAGLVAGPAAPLVMGAFSGYDQGIQQAEAMGIHSPDQRAALGAGFGAAEVLTERMFGIGNKAATQAMREALRRSGGQMAKGFAKSTLGEGAEEFAAGAAQEAMSLGMAPESYDSTDLRPFNPGTWDMNPRYVSKRGHDVLGGMVGGGMFGALDVGLNLAKKPQPMGAVPDPLATHAATMPETFSAPETDLQTADTDARFMPPDFSASVTPAASQVPTPEAAAQAPVPNPADAGSTPAAGTILPTSPAASASPNTSAAGANDEASLATDAIEQTPVALNEQRGVTLPNENATIEGSGTVQPDRGRVPVPAFADPNALAQVQAGAGNVFVDLPKTPAALAAQQADEQKLAELRSASEAIARNKDKPPQIPDAPYGGYDVLDFVNENIIRVPPPEERTGGEYDWMETADLPPQYGKYLFHGKRGKAIDKVAQMAYEENLISDPTADALLTAIESTIKTRDGYTEGMKQREPALTEEEKAATAQSESWADNVIRDSMETPFIGIDPKLMAAYTVKGAQLIREGFTSFAKWSREMIARFGEKVRDYLQGAWQAAMNTSEQGFIGTGDTRFQPPGTINLTHEAEAERMEAEGKPALPTGGQGTVEEWTAEAAERVQQPGAAGALVSDIIAQQRPATPVEHYMLMNYAAALDADLARADGTLADPGTTPEARAAAAETKRTQDAERDRVEVAAQIAGSKAGAALGARSRGLDRGAVPSLSKMVADITLIQDPTGKTPLAPEERAKIEQVHTKLVDAEAAVEKQTEEGVGGARNTYNEELQKLLKEAQDEIASHKEQLARQQADIENAMKPRPAAIKSKTILKRVMDEADAAEQRLRAAGFFGGTTNIGIDPSMILDLAKVGAGYLARGIDFTLAMTRKFGEQIRPFINQIRDTSERLLKEETKKKSPDDVKEKMRATVKAGKDLPGDIARKLALAHIVDHLERGDKTMSAEKIAKLVAQDLQEFLPGITDRQARDLISGYGKTSTQSQEEARKALRDLAAQMQKLTQLEALMAKEKLLKSGPQRDEPSARLRELQKQVEALKKDVGYESRSKEEELKSARDRIKKALENQIEELQRILAGKAAPVTQRDKITYDADLNALKTLRNSLKDLVAELPQHKLATEARRNKAALKAAQASEAEWNRRAKALEWTRPGNRPVTYPQDVLDAKAKAKEARANFHALKKAADPRNDPEARALREFKSRTQSQIKAINKKIAAGAFDPPKKTPRQIKHDAASDKLAHDLEMKKREWIDLKLKHRIATMGWGGKGLELVRKLYHLARSIKAGGEFSGVLNQGIIPLASHPLLTTGSIPQMFKAFMSAQNETSINQKIWMRANAINGRYKRHKLAVRDPAAYSDLQAEGNYRSAWGDKIPFFSGAGRAYTTLLNHMRADLFDALATKLEARKARRGETVTDRELDILADEVNDSTGAGKLALFGKREINGSAKDLLGALVFSPAFVAARARYLLHVNLFGGTKDSARIVIEERIRTIAGFAAMYALSLALQGDDDEPINATDATDSTYMKVKFGKTYVDLLGGLQQVAVLFQRLVKGEMSTNGKTQSLDGTGRKDRSDVLLSFAKSKRSPAAAFVWDSLIRGKDYNGKPSTIPESLGELITPMTWETISEMQQAEPARRSVPLSAGAFFGLRTDTRDDDVIPLAKRFTGQGR